MVLAFLMPTQTMPGGLLDLAKTAVMGLLALGHSIYTLASCISHSPNERTHNACIVSSMNNSSLTQIQYDGIVGLLRKSGNMLLNMDADDYPSTFNFSVSPVVEWDSNANGGNPSKPLEVGSLVLTGDQNLNQKSALLVGLSASVLARKVIGDQSFLDIKAHSTYSQPLNHSFTVNEYGYSACGSLGLASNLFFDQCYVQNSSEKEIRDIHIYKNKSTPSQIFETSNGIGAAEVSIEIQKSDSVTTVQDAVAFSHDSQNNIFYRIELFKKKPHQKTPSALSSKGFTLSLYSKWFDRNSYLIFSNESFSVQTFLNYPIYRSAKGIVFGSEFVSDNYIELSVINNQSNVDYYSGVASTIAWRAVN